MPFRKILPSILTLIFIACISKGTLLYLKSKEFGAPPYVGDELDLNDSTDDDFDAYANWKRPNGPIKIGLQAGHWKTSEMPQEQNRIKENGGGTSGQGIPEWQVVLDIAQKVAELLANEGYVVDILPATVPESYRADAFISIHADGNLNPTVTGYKVAGYQRDRTRQAQALSDFISEEYGKVTKLPVDPNISRNMTRYYAFNSRRYRHAIHPMTPGVIVETGFMTNHRDSTMLINSPEIPAHGIANGIINFIQQLNIKNL